MFFETITHTVLTHPFQVALAGVTLFYAVCEGLAALPLRTRRKVPQAQVSKAA